MGELEDKLVEALARAMTAEKIADRALSMAQEALMKVEALKQGQGNYYAYPNYDTEPSVLESPVSEPTIEGEEGTRPRRLSPFAMPHDLMNIKPRESTREEPEI